MKAVRLVESVLVWVVVAAGGCVSSASREVVPAAQPGFPRFLEAVASRDSAGRLLASQRFREAAAAYLECAARLPDLIAPGWTFYEAATAYALAKDPDAAFGALESAQAHGFHDASGLASDTALARLPRTERWRGLSAGVSTNEKRYRSAHANPARAQIHTEDIPRFWRAFDLAAGQDSTAAAAVFLREYIAQGTRGLFDFYRMKIVSPTRLARTTGRFPRFYESIRRPTSELPGLEPVIRRVFQDTKALYPEVIYPDLYFVIGRINSAGTATDYGLFFGAEQNVASSSTVLDELPETLRRIVFPREELPHVIAHELVHFQQHYADKHTLLDVALIEGGATFIAQLVLPVQRTPYFRTWGAAHEREVWARFAGAMNSDSIANWVGNTGTEAWPADLGRLVGYQISQAYYDSMSDKKKAIRDLIRLEDSRAILRASRYGGQLGQ